MIEYILTQTQLTTLVVEHKGLEKIGNLAKEGKIGKLKNLIQVAQLVCLKAHSALLAEINILESNGFTVRHDDVYLSFLPLAHIMERLIITLLISHSIAIGFYTGNPRELVNNEQVLQPTCLCGVPCIFQRIYAEIHKKINQCSPFMQRIIHKAIEQELTEFHKSGIAHINSALY